MKRSVGGSLVYVSMGLLASLFIALGYAQFAENPPCSIAAARESALAEIRQRSNSTRPIWPAMIVTGRGVTVRAFHTDDSPTESNPMGQTFIAVAIEAGWPWRCLRAETKYLASIGWTTPQYVLPLPTWPNARRGAVISDLPLQPMWGGLAINTLVFAIGLWLVFGAPGAIRRSWRRRKGQCAACGYPIGVNRVCTECGADLNSSIGREALGRR